MRTFFSLVVFVIIIFLLVHISMFFQKHSNALGELIENSNDLIKNSNALLINNNENITVSIEKIANVLEKSDSLITEAEGEDIPPVTCEDSKEWDIEVECLAEDILWDADYDDAEPAFSTTWGWPTGTNRDRVRVPAPIDATPRS